MNREERHKKRERALRIRHALLFGFIATFIGLCIIGVVAYLSTNVYQNEDEFKEYIAEEMKNSHQFNVEDVKKMEYEYGTPISYAVDYGVCENESIAAFRDERINAIKAEYEAEKTAEETKKAKDDEKYKPKEHALIIKSQTFKSDRGVISLYIYGSDNAEKDKDMEEVATYIQTYQFSEKTGKQLIPQQIFKENYKGICSEYFTKYFEKNYDKELLVKDWKKNLSAAADHFNSYILTGEDATFFFDEGTVLKKSEGVAAAGIMNVDIENGIRDKIIERYIDPEKPMVAITYDDGPGGKAENRILDVFEKNGDVATFFYLGNRVSGDKETLKRAYDMGCEIGSHTWSHPVLTKLSDSKVKEQFSKTNKSIESVCGSIPTVFRPSYGETNEKINKLSGSPVIMWSVDTLDWKSRDGKKIFNKVKKSKNLDGQIILMHSIYDSTADATEMIVPWLKEHGYQLVTVSELIRYKTGEEAKPGEVYRVF